MPRVDSRLRGNDEATIRDGCVSPVEMQETLALPSSSKARDKPWFRMTVGKKYCIVLVCALAWMLVAEELSLPWLSDLSQVIGWPLALFVIMFLAYWPGFMNAFLIGTILADRRPKRRELANYPPVAVLVACYNESPNIRNTLVSLHGQDYPGMCEVIVIDDGSTDDTLSIARAAAAELQRERLSIRVLAMPKNGGKAAALNHGLAQSSPNLVVTVDGDSQLHPTALRHIVERFESDPPNTAAVAGAVFVRNADKNFLCGMQKWDYFHGIAAVKRMQSMYHGTLVAQGAFSLYTRAVLESVGGWPECIGEDIVVSWAILERGYRIGYCEDACAFTDVPESVKQFARQRQRWSRGLVEAFQRHWRLLFHKRMTTMFIWWNLMFLPMDLVYTFAFIPGIILALFGYQHIVGPMTLAVLPLGALWNLVIFNLQARMFRAQGIDGSHNWREFILFATSYSMILQPICVLGYAKEFLKMRKTWGTK
jgi:biofilm PGA synthesis N-glycosyltransferase PgaC